MRDERRVTNAMTWSASQIVAMASTNSERLRLVKDRIRDRWDDFIVEQGFERASFHVPTRNELSCWVAESILHDIDEHIVRNAWKPTDLSYFPEE